MKMKLNKLALGWGVTAVLASGASAIEKPAAAEEAAGKDPGNAQIELPAEAEKAPKAASKPWLGVAGKAINETLSAQLGIKQGVALDLIAPQGPAANAGINQHDIITKVGEREVANMDDLRAAIAELKPHQELNLEVVSRGKVANKKITIGERPANMPEMLVPQEMRMQGGNIMPKELFQALPKEQRERIENAMAEQMKRIEMHFNGNLIPQAGPAPGGKLQMNLGELMLNGGAGFQAGASVTMMDDEGSISMKTFNNAKEVEVKDKNGKVLYSGPYETEVDKAAVPDDIRARIDASGIEGQNLKLKIQGK